MKWQILFTDQGWGFDSHNTKKIFKRFYRAESGAPKAISGTGLGLFLAKNACKSLNVDLKGYSPGRGRGATFIIEGIVQ